MLPPFYQPTHPPPLHWRDFSSDVRQAPLSYIKLPPRLMLENLNISTLQSLYLYSVFLQENLPQPDTNRGLREVHRYAVVSLSWLSMIYYSSVVWGGHSVLTRHRPVNNYQSRSVELLQHSQSPLCRLQSPLKPVPRLPPTNRQMVGGDGGDGNNYLTRTFTRPVQWSVVTSAALQSHLLI